MLALLKSTLRSLGRVPSEGRLTQLLRRVVVHLDAHRQRRALASLEDAMLRDVGLTRAQAMAEAGRPVWDVPETWRDCGANRHESACSLSLFSGNRLK